MKKILILLPLTFLVCLTVSAQTDQQDLNREVTLYNPYKPSLPVFLKRSYLPDISDTAKLRPDFTYDVVTTAYTPEYTISPIKPAALLPDPLPKLYKSYVRLGFGNYITPLAEVSITNERSKKGAIGFYGRHFSTNGKILLKEDVDKVFAGYMDNDVSLYGKKFFRGTLLEGAVDFTQKLRYAYGYDTMIVDYDPEKKDIRMGYNNLGADISFASLTLDSSSYSYDFDLNYDYFYHTNLKYQHNIGLTGIMATKYEGFYIGSGLDVQYAILSKSLYDKSKYIVSLSPFVKKSTPQWNFKAGLQLLLDRNMTDKPEFHIYPDVNFGFSVVPSYVRFFAALNGKLERNGPEKIMEENPFLVRDGSLFKLNNTSHNLIVSAGLNGNNGIGGNYVLSASYSVIDDMLFYANQVDTIDIISPEMGNFFIALPDDGEVLKIHGEITGLIKDKIWYGAEANWYNYSLTLYDFPLNKPDWDATIGLKYNLRNKIIAGASVCTLGNRQLAFLDGTTMVKLPEKEPIHVNINLNAEYRYSKILSFWLKINNIAFNKYYEYAFYPTQRFVCMVGFSYSL
ncbi:MAG: hypothetical protein MUF36_04525 [Bacteroidales bacterium]|jgi:hypothetical protein|nr:hypothetical protein [Bacteroidales bacterium]